ncbi:MAG TPA: histidine kinase, partial [Pseudomonas sp.]|nr:histidine kinase [Pseudomonas sp.]
MADPIATTGEAELLEQLRRENESLRAELEETNQGVLALYAELDTQAEQ